MAGHAMAPVHAAAVAAYRAGLCVLPVKAASSKAPDVASWKKFRARRPSIDEMRGFRFATRDGIGIVAGAVSQHIELWDFDTDAVYQDLTTAADACGLGELWTRLITGYLDRTPNGGRR